MGEENRDPIYFHSKTTAYYELSNFSPHGFQLDGAYWPTSHMLARLAVL